MFDQPNPAAPEPEDILSPIEGGVKPQTALEAGQLRPVARPIEAGGEPAAPEPAEIKAPLLSRRKLIIIGAIVLLAIIAVVVIFAFRGAPEPQVTAPVPPAPPATPVPTLEIPPLVEPAPAPPAVPPITAPAPPAVEVPTTPPDSDGDGLTDEEEVAAGTNPVEVDTDRDGLNDREELRVWQTNPLNPDTDSDGFMDGQEVQNGYNPNGPGRLLIVPPVS